MERNYFTPTETIANEDLVETGAVSIRCAPSHEGDSHSFSIKHGLRIVPAYWIGAALFGAAIWTAAVNLI